MRNCHRNRHRNPFRPVALVFAAALFVILASGCAFAPGIAELQWRSASMIEARAARGSCQRIAFDRRTGRYGRERPAGRDRSKDSMDANGKSPRHCRRASKAASMRRPPPSWATHSTGPAGLRNQQQACTPQRWIWPRSTGPSAHRRPRRVVGNALIVHEGRLHARWAVAMTVTRWTITPAWGSNHQHVDRTARCRAAKAAPPPWVTWAS